MWQAKIELTPFAPGALVQVRESKIPEQIARMGRVIESNGRVKVLLEGDQLFSSFSPDDLIVDDQEGQTKGAAVFNTLIHTLSREELEEVWLRIGRLLGREFTELANQAFHPLTGGKKRQSNSGGAPKRHYNASGWIKHGSETKISKKTGEEQIYDYVAYSWSENGKEKTKRFPKVIEEEVRLMIDSRRSQTEILSFIASQPKPKKPGKSKSNRRGN